MVSDRGVSCKATFVILFKQFALVFLQLEFWLYMLRFSSITVCLFVELFALVVLLVDSLGSVDEGTTGGIGVDVVPSSALSNTVVTLWLVVAFAAANCAWSSALSFWRLFTCVCSAFIFVSKPFIVWMNTSIWAITWCGWPEWLVVTSVSEMLSLKIFSSSLEEIDWLNWSRGTRCL